MSSIKQAAVQELLKQGIKYPTFRGTCQTRDEVYPHLLEVGDVFFEESTKKHIVYEPDGWTDYKGNVANLYIETADDFIMRLNRHANDSEQDIKQNEDQTLPLQTMFELQAKLQSYCFNVKLPAVNEGLFQYYMLGLFGEAGEVLAADKQWKPCNKGPRDQQEVTKELTDCFLFLINACLAQNVTADDIAKEFIRKNNKVFARIDKDRAEGNEVALVK